MDIYARVNILDGRAVRLPRGDVSQAIALDADPIARAQGWVRKGADKLLIVDLDAAAYGEYGNRSLITSLIKAVDVPVQVAGGIRSAGLVERALEDGAWRVTMGTAAIVDQVLTWEICRDHPGQIVISIDVNADLELVIRGWQEGSGQYLEESIIELSSAGAAALMVAEVGRDPLTEPPNHFALTTALQNVTPAQEIIAAGGVRNLDDLREIRDIEHNGDYIDGVVVGREVSEGRFTIEEAVALARLQANQ